jgi:hypothetical protein
MNRKEKVEKQFALFDKAYIDAKQTEQTGFGGVYIDLVKMQTACSLAGSLFKEVDNDNLYEQYEKLLNDLTDGYQGIVIERVKGMVDSVRMEVDSGLIDLD